MNKPRRNRYGRKPHVPRKPPVPLPPREHRLSFTDGKEPGTTDLRMLTSDQAQSLFFSLPKELRLQIYEYILSGKLLHLGFEDYDIMRASYLRRYPCLSGSDASDWVHDSCWSRSAISEEKLLPLLQSCRLVYVPFLTSHPTLHSTNSKFSDTLRPRSYNEAISILYRANTFSFKDSECLQYFPTLIPRQRFEAIQSLKLDVFLWDFPSADPSAKEHYEEIWRLIASMPRLRELRVRLTRRSRPVIEDWKLNEATWLAPLKGFKGLKVFELDLPFMEASEISKDIDLGECRIHALPEWVEE